MKKTKIGIDEKETIFMAVKVKETSEKVTPAKKTITIEDIVVKASTFIDADGENITDAIINALPDGVENITLKFTIELPPTSDYESEEE